jgi:hypothetical protein
MAEADIAIKHHLESLIADAGEPDHHPLQPKNGIPIQKLPGFIRWPVRAAFWPFMMLDLNMQKVAKWLMRTPFRQEGKCLQRGNCCTYILLPKAKGLLNGISLFWNTEILGFYLRSEELVESNGKPAYVMGCRYLKKDGKCGHYRMRPAVCRKWPMIEYFGIPRLLKGCGFRPVVRGKAFAGKSGLPVYKD